MTRRTTITSRTVHSYGIKPCNRKYPQEKQTYGVVVKPKDPASGDGILIQLNGRYLGKCSLSPGLVVYCVQKREG